MPVPIECGISFLTRFRLYFCLPQPISWSWCVAQVTSEQTCNCVLSPLSSSHQVLCESGYLPFPVTHCYLSLVLRTEEWSASQRYLTESLFLSCMTGAEREKQRGTSGKQSQQQVLLYRVCHLDLTDCSCESQGESWGKIHRLTALTTFNSCYSCGLLFCSTVNRHEQCFFSAKRSYRLWVMCNLCGCRTY